MTINKHLYLAYSQNERDDTNDSYFPIDSELLSAINEDPRVSDSLIFDLNRKTIYAKGNEFGGLNPVFPKMAIGKFEGVVTQTNLLTDPAYFITGVYQDQYGRVSYSYSSAYTRLKLDAGILLDEGPGTYVTGLAVNENGELTYTYSDVHHDTTFGQLAASIYCVNDNTVEEIITYDPKKIMLGHNIGAVVESNFDVNLYDLSTGDLIECITNTEDFGLLTISPNDDIVNVRNGLIYTQGVGWYELENLDMLGRAALFYDDIMAIIEQRSEQYKIYRRHPEKLRYAYIGALMPKMSSYPPPITSNGMYWVDPRSSFLTLSTFAEDHIATSSVVSIEQMKSFAIYRGDDYLDYDPQYAYIKNEKAVIKEEDTRDDEGAKPGLDPEIPFNPPQLKGTDIHMSEFGERNGVPKPVTLPVVLGISQLKDMTFECSYVSLVFETKTGNSHYLVWREQNANYVGPSPKEDPNGGDESKADNQKYILSYIHGVDNQQKVIVNNDELICALDFEGNVSLHAIRDGFVECIRPNVLTNVSELVSFDYDQDTGSTFVKALHGIDTAIIDYVFLDVKGDLIYHQHDATIDEGEYDGDIYLNNDSGLSVVTHISQEPNGQVHYEYVELNTNFYTEEGSYIESEPIDDNGLEVLTDVYLDENGTLTYSYTNIHVNQAAQAVTLSYLEGLEIPAQNSYSVIWLYKDAENENKITFSYADLSSGSNAGTVEDPITLQTGAYQIITNISQNGDGKITYSYAMLNTTHSGSFNTDDGFITSVSLSPDGVLNASGKEFKTVENRIYDRPGSGVVTYAYLNEAGTLHYDLKNLQFEFSGDFINHFEMDASGKVSVIAGTFAYEGDNVIGPVMDVSIGHDGKISYVHRNLETVEGSYEYVTYSKGNKIANGTTCNAYTQVITSISQESDGKLSYSYVGLYTDPRDYSYHNFTMSLLASPAPDPNYVQVLTGLGLTNNGLAQSHVLSMSSTILPTKRYIDDLIESNDAMHYCGIVDPGSTPGSPVHLHCVVNNEEHTNSWIYSTGAVYKVRSPGYFGTEYVVPGDMIISYSDAIRTFTSEDNVHGLSDLRYWNVINQNIALINDYKGNTKNSDDNSLIITNIHMYDNGTLSYNAYQLTSTTSGSNKFTEAGTSSNDYDLLSSDSRLRVITGVELSTSGINTELSYEYGYVYADPNHHSVVKNKAGGPSKVIGFVDMSASGELSYSYVDIAKPAYHYSPTPNGEIRTSEAVVVPINGNATDTIKAYTNIVLDNKNHVVGSTTISYNIKHGEANTAGSYMTFNPAATYVTTMFTYSNGHILSYAYTKVTDSHVLISDKNDSTRRYFTGAKDVPLNGSIISDLNVDGISYWQNEKCWFSEIGTPAIKVNDLTTYNDTAFRNKNATFTIANKTIDFGDSNPIGFENLGALWGEIS